MTEIFVFGSNLLGIHKKGAALHALRVHGAQMGQGVGLQGNSYAIPTKQSPARSLDLVQINKFVADFLNYAYYAPDLVFNVTKIGCGLAGFSPNQIAPMFNLVKLMRNVRITKDFADNIPGFEHWVKEFPQLIYEFPAYD